MVNLLTGPKGSGKTQQMIELANKAAKESDGHVFFIKKATAIHTAYLLISVQSAWMTMKRSTILMPILDLFMA